MYKNTFVRVRHSQNANLSNVQNYKRFIRNILLQSITLFYHIKNSNKIFTSYIICLKDICKYKIYIDNSTLHDVLCALLEGSVTN